MLEAKMPSNIDVRGTTRDDTEKSRRLNFENIDYSLRNITAAHLKSQKDQKKTIASLTAEIENLKIPKVSLTMDFAAAANNVTATTVIGGMLHDSAIGFPVFISMHGTQGGATRLMIAYLYLTAGSQRLSIYLRRNGAVIASLANLISNSSTQPSSHFAFANSTFIDYSPSVGINIYDLQIVYEGSAGTYFNYYPFKMITTELG